jgi:excisionase family DNA binding protein
MLFTAEEVAKSLAVSTTLIRQITLAGELPCRRIGRLVRYTPADVQTFIEHLDARGYG